MILWARAGVAEPVTIAALEKVLEQLRHAGAPASATVRVSPASLVDSGVQLGVVVRAEW